MKQKEEVDNFYLIVSQNCEEDDDRNCMMVIRFVVVFPWRIYINM